ncbi:MAG: DMT family transporter [Alphaproteobacteria bacterium]|nr:MAG: DMT family transporter [Alphaproteobacteria bacterium]
MARSYLLTALSMCLVGGTVAVAKVLSAELPVFVIGFLRCLIAALVLLVWEMARRRGQFGAAFQNLTRADLTPIAGQALFGILAFTVFLFYGIRASSAFNAGIISATLPAAVAVLSYLWLKERLTPLQALSIPMAVGGVMILNLQGAGGAGAGHWVGNGLIFLAVLSEATYTIFAKQSASRLPLGITALLVNLVALALFAPLAVGPLLTMDWHGHGGLLWLLLGLYAVGSSVLALVLWYEGVKLIPANVAGLFTGFVPISAGVLAVVFLEETPTLAHGLGAGLVFFAIWLGARRQKTA